MDNENTGATCTPNVATANSQKIYEVAAAHLNQSLCENHMFGCMETVNNIFEIAFGSEIGGRQSTYMGYQYLTGALKGKYTFVEVTDPLPGDVIISPTGYGKSEVMPNGHVGIVAKYGILSNNSYTGRLEEGYKLDSWKARYADRGGYPVKFFRVQ